MITLHGFAFSNYYNIVKHVLMHKDIAFEEDLQFGGTDAYLEISPVGKIPSMTTEQGGHLSESSVCCDYLEDAYPDQAPLYPADPYARGQVRQVMKVSELYLELPCRRLIPFAFQNTDAPEALKEEVRATLERGIGAMNRLCVFDPYVLGGEMTMADIYLRYVLKVVNLAGSAKLEWDIVAQIDGLAAWDAMMGESEISQKIDADQEANGPHFFNHLKERFGI
jgi:glutathione S-transferase